MAAGGTYLTYNKVLPGAYINFISKARSMGSMGERGVVALPFRLNWGEENKIITITLEEFQKNSTKILGYSYTSDEMKNLREVFCSASSIKLFRLGSGEKASANLGNLTVNAKYSGSRGNDIKIKISNSLEKDGAFSIQTFLENTLVSECTAKSIGEIKNNDFVTFSGDGEITANAGTSLSNGTDTEATKEAYVKFLDLVEAEQFTTILYDGSDEPTKSLFTSFTKRLRDEEGFKITAILHDYSKADFEGVISLKNNPELIYWLTGATASANVNESLTNKTYNGEYNIEAKFTNTEMKSAIENGEILIYFDGSNLKVLKDINTFTTFTSDKNSDFSNNQVIRVLDSVANDIGKIFNTYYLGKVQNNKLGRDLFKSEVIDYINSLQAINAVQSFTSDDISISAGVEKGDVTVDLSLMPIAAMEKLYMQCIIE